MAWIESHQKLKEDDKLFDLMDKLQMDMRSAVGTLHLFWWWCVDHAENGDLRGINDAHIGRIVGLNGDDCKKLVDGLVGAGFIEREPYFRVANWWKFIGKYLMSKYKDTPNKWKIVRRAYNGEVTDKLRRSNTTPPNQPNLTYQTHLTNIPEDLHANAKEIEDWLIYKQGRREGYKPGDTGIGALWRTLRAIPPDQLRAAIDHSMASGYKGIFPPKGGQNGPHIAPKASPGKYAV